MITLERVGEVFEITPGPWKLEEIKGYCIDNIIGSNDELVCQLDVPLVAKHNNSSLIKASPEMLCGLVNILDEVIGCYAESEKMIIKAIESVDFQGRKWAELKKELEK